MKLTKEAEALISLLVAESTRKEARRAWRQAGKSERSLRVAFRSCVLAARCVRKAAEEWAHDPRSAKLFASAKQLEVARDELLARLSAMTGTPAGSATK